MRKLHTKEEADNNEIQDNQNYSENTLDCNVSSSIDYTFDMDRLFVL